MVSADSISYENCSFECSALDPLAKVGFDATKVMSVEVLKVLAAIAEGTESLETSMILGQLIIET